MTGAGLIQFIIIDFAVFCAEKLINIFSISIQGSSIQNSGHFIPECQSQTPKSEVEIL